MNELVRKSMNAARRTSRTRSILHGTSAKPRMSVHVSNQHISAQLIDDDSMRTIASASSRSLPQGKQTMTEKAVLVGKEIAKKAKTAHITEAVFDRGPKQYHGRIKALADAAREEGLKL